MILQEAKDHCWSKLASMTGTEIPGHRRRGNISCRGPKQAFLGPGGKFESFLGNEDVGAFAYYASFGLVDPKNALVDAPALAGASGMGYFRALATVSIVGAVTWGAIGYVVDPADKREGGLAEDDWYKMVTDPGYWFGPGKWY